MLRDAARESSSTVRRTTRAASETLGERFLLRRQPSLEAQIANLADEIAYSNHDIDDGIRSGLLDAAQLEQVPLLPTSARPWPRQMPGIGDTGVRSYETVRRIIDTLVSDLIEESSRRIAAAAPG